MTELEQRVGRLERENRWMRRVSAVVVASLTVVLLVGQAENERPLDLVVHSLEVVDITGSARIRLAVDTGDAKMLFVDGRGKERISLETKPGGLAGLAVADSNGQPRVTAGVFGGVSGVVLLGAPLEKRAALQVTADGAPTLELGGKKERWSKLDPQGFTAGDETGKVRVRADHDGIHVLDDAGKGAWVHAEGLGVRDEARRLRLAAGRDGLTRFDAAGKPIR